MTADLDLLVDLGEDNLASFLTVMQELGYRPRLPVPASDLLAKEKRAEWISNKNLHAFTFWNESRPFQEVDVLIKASEDSAMINRAEPLRVDDMDIYLASVDDLIAMKRLAGRKQDQADIDSLTKLKDLTPES
jgi:hypothetical protein